MLACLPAATLPRASPALVSVLWAPLVRAPVVGLFGLREGGGTSLLDSRLRGNDGDACAGMTDNPPFAYSLSFRAERGISPLRGA